MILDLLQTIILMVLMFCMFFGIGFILNMLLKTTWVPTIVFFVFVVGLVIYWSWDSGSFIENIKGYTLADYLPGVTGLIGVILSGYTIRFLRVKGYKMF